MNKALKNIVLTLEDIMGDYPTRCLLSNIIYALVDRSKDGGFELRTMELAINGFFYYDLMPKEESNANHQDARQLD